MKLYEIWLQNGAHCEIPAKDDEDAKARANRIAQSINTTVRKIEELRFARRY